MTTLAELEQEFGAEVLLEVAASLGIEPKDSYNADDAELSAIRAEALKLSTSATSSTSTTSGSGKKRTSGSAEVRKSAIDRTNEKVQKNQGAMVAGKTQAAKAIAKVERKQGSQDAALANRTYAESFLEVRAKGYEEFANSYLGAGDTLSQITDREFDGEEDESPLSIGGGFSLSF